VYAALGCSTGQSWRHSNCRCDGASAVYSPRSREDVVLSGSCHSDEDHEGHNWNFGESL